MTKELDIAVHTLATYPEMNNPIKMEVGSVGTLISKINAWTIIFCISRLA